MTRKMRKMLIFQLSGNACVRYLFIGLLCCSLVCPYLTFSSTIIRWSPKVKDELTKNNHIPCKVLLIAVDEVACGK